MLDVQLEGRAALSTIVDGLGTDPSSSGSPGGPGHSKQPPTGGRAVSVLTFNPTVRRPALILLAVHHDQQQHQHCTL